MVLEAMKNDGTGTLQDTFEFGPSSVTFSDNVVEG